MSVLRILPPLHFCSQYYYKQRPVDGQKKQDKSPEKIMYPCELVVFFCVRNQPQNAEHGKLTTKVLLSRDGFKPWFISTLVTSMLNQTMLIHFSGNTITSTTIVPLITSFFAIFCINLWVGRQLHLIWKTPYFRQVWKVSMKAYLLPSFARKIYF